MIRCKRHNKHLTPDTAGLNLHCPDCKVETDEMLSSIEANKRPVPLSKTAEYKAAVVALSMDYLPLDPSLQPYRALLDLIKQREQT